MNTTEWPTAIQKMMNNVVKVSICGNGHGSGVIVPPPKNAPGNCCILTAFHVIRKAQETGATIEITLSDSKTKFLLHSLQRYIFEQKQRDQALIIFSSNQKLGDISTYELPKHPGYYAPGTEFGWLGWPGLAIANQTVCFCRGVVSAYLQKEDAYLVDGSSIHGNSGGPVFCCETNNKVFLAGIVTNYYPDEVPVNNGSTPQAWPGLAMFRTVNPLLALYEKMNKSSQQKLSPIASPSKSIKQLEEKGT